MTAYYRIRSGAGGRADACEVDAAELAAQPLARAETPPAGWYVEPRFHAFEREAVFARSWQAVGHAGQVAAPGAYFTAEVAGEPVLVVRGEDGALRGFYNVCRHRAGPLATERQGCARLLRCRYHGWTYGLDGALRGSPCWRGVEGFERGEHALAPVAVAEWRGLVLVHLERAAEGFEASTRGLAERLAGATPAAGELAHEAVYEVACNWKVYVENYLEGYHVPLVHPELTRLYDLRSYTSEVAGRWSLQWTRLAPGDATYATRAGDCAYYVFVFPNLMLNVLPGRLQTNLVEPLAADRCRVTFRYFYAEGTPAEARAADIAFSDRVQAEDGEICGHVQRGLASRSYSRGRLSVEEEAAVHHFHELLRACYRLQLAG